MPTTSLMVRELQFQGPAAPFISVMLIYRPSARRSTELTQAT